MCSTCDCNQVANEIHANLKLVGVDQDEQLSALKPCRKCGQMPYIVLDKVHVECRQCFLESCNKKIRSTIGKSKLIRNNDPVLIAHSGGPSSGALLDLINNSIKSQTKREQKLAPSILHVDVQSIFNDKPDEQFLTNRCSRIKSLLDRLSQTYKGWPIYWTTLEAAMTTIGNKEEEEKEGQGGAIGKHKLFSTYQPDVHESFGANDDHLLLLNNSEMYEQLHKKMAAYGDLTDCHQYLQDLCSDLINRVAIEISSTLAVADLGSPDDHREDRRFKYVFTGHTSTQLANNLLVDVILGKGSSIRSAVGICDTRPAIPVVRPMRDFSKKEVAFYLRARGIDDQVFVDQNLLLFAARKSSIQTVTEAFLSKLYVDYPSTYSTLLKTGNKMQPDN